VEMVKRTWESLRRQYNRGVANEVRNEPNKWRLFPLMRFLDDKKPPWTWNAPAEPQERWMR
jgi:hypothetical protein